MLNAFIGFLGLGLLGFPGWLLARASRLRAPLLAGFLAGGVGIVTLVLVLQLTGRALSPLNLAAGWGAWTLVAILLAQRAGKNTPAIACEPAIAPEQNSYWPWLIAAPVLAAISFRAFARPLFGTDTHFRWGFLAEQMWQRQTLAFYPPVTPAGLEVYAWPDGIPPLVSSIYFGLYCLAGKVEPAVTGPVVTAQFFLLLAAAAALARRLFSPAAGSWTIAVLGVAPLAAWATSMGQETGLMALAVVALFLYLPRDRAEENMAAMVAAGIAAAVAALAREYGWAFVAIAGVLCGTRKLSPRGVAALAAVVVLTAVPWYVRNWMLSGNPFFNLSTGGLFSVNEAHAALMAVYREHFGFMPQLRDWSFWPFLNALVVLVTATAGALRFFSAVRALIVAIAVAIVLWITSVAYTAAGFMYAMRVLNPGLALGAVLGGAWLATQATSRNRRRFAIVVLALAGLDAALRTLVLPDRPYHRAAADWFTADVAPADYQAQRRASFGAIAQQVGHGRVLALGLNNVMTRLGVAAVPPWSPDVAFLFDPKCNSTAASRQLRALGFTHVLISKGDLNREYLDTSPFFHAASARELQPVINVDEFILFAIVAS